MTPRQHGFAVRLDLVEQRHRVLSSGDARIPQLVDGGLPVVLSQTFRSLIHSRLELGMKGYEGSHPHTDIELFEPDHRDPEMFLANTFGYAQRRALAEHAYQRTRADLRSRRSTPSGEVSLSVNGSACAATPAPRWLSMMKPTASATQNGMATTKPITSASPKRARTHARPGWSR